MGFLCVYFFGFGEEQGPWCDFKSDFPKFGRSKAFRNHGVSPEGQQRKESKSGFKNKTHKPPRNVRKTHGKKRRGNLITAVIQDDVLPISSMG